MSKQPKVAICLSNNQQWMPSEFFWKGITALLKPKHITLRGTAHNKFTQLNEMTKQGMEDPDITHFFFMDLDMTFEPTCLLRLLNNNKDICSALYYGRKPPFTPVAGWIKGQRRMVNSDGVKWNKQYAPFEPKLQEVDWAGIGALLVKREVFEQMKYPYFRDLHSTVTGGRSLGHDVDFCKRAKKQGFEVYCDGRINCGHVTQWLVDRSFVEAFHESDLAEIMGKKCVDYYGTDRYWDTVWIMSENRNYQIEFDIIIENIDKGSEVLDIGAGPGTLLYRLKTEKDCIVTGLDFSEYSMKRLKAKGIKGIKENILTWEPDEQYDVVTCTQVLEHFESGDFLMEKLYKATKDGGKVIIDVPDKDIGIGKYEHRILYTKDSLESLMNKYFKNVTITIAPEVNGRNGIIAVGVK